MTNMTNMTNRANMYNVADITKYLTADDMRARSERLRLISTTTGACSREVMANYQRQARALAIAAEKGEKKNV